MSEVTEDYRLDEQVGYLLRLAMQRHAGIFQARSPGGLTPTQFAAMIRLSEEGSVSQNQLGRLAAMDIATIKGVVDRLRQKGLVTAKASREDKRRNVIALTPEGMALIAELKEQGAEISAETMAPLSASEARTLVKLLGKLG